MRATAGTEAGSVRAWRSAGRQGARLGQLGTPRARPGQTGRPQRRRGKRRGANREFAVRVHAENWPRTRLSLGVLPHGCLSATRRPRWRSTPWATRLAPPTPPPPWPAPAGHHAPSSTPGTHLATQRPIPTSITRSSFTRRRQKTICLRRRRGRHRRLWDAATGKVIRAPGITPSSPRRTPRLLAGNDGRSARSKGVQPQIPRGMVVMMWDVVGGKLLRSMPEDDPVGSWPSWPEARRSSPPRRDEVRWWDRRHRQKGRASVASRQQLGPAIRPDEDNPAPRAVITWTCRRGTTPGHRSGTRPEGQAAPGRSC